MASLWQVADWAAAETMTTLYEKRLQEGLPTAQALREAKLSLRRFEGPQTPRGMALVAKQEKQARRAEVKAGHPFYWAPFIYIGLAE